MSLSKVYLNQVGTDWPFVINEVLFILGIDCFVSLDEMLHIKYRWKTALPNTAFQKSEKWAVFWWFKYLIKQWMHCGDLAENIHLLALYVYPFFIFFAI